jgi:GTP cyclohydrolase III
MGQILGLDVTMNNATSAQAGHRREQLLHEHANIRYGKAIMLALQMRSKTSTTTTTTSMTCTTSTTSTTIMLALQMRSKTSTSIMFGDDDEYDEYDEYDELALTGCPLFVWCL